jgi:tRNA(fMet)-specific endonuclease VapC
MNYLLDTCVISELVANNPDPKVVQWIDSTDEIHLFLSVVTIGEIQKGVEKLPHSKRKTALRQWLSEQLPARFASRIVAIDAETMLTWGQLVARLDRQGHPMPAIDSLIAAIALHGNFTLVTRNEEDFKHAGVLIFNPWK